MCLLWSIFILYEILMFRINRAVIFISRFMLLKEYTV